MNKMAFLDVVFRIDERLGEYWIKDATIEEIKE